MNPLTRCAETSSCLQCGRQNLHSFVSKLVCTISPTTSPWRKKAVPGPSCASAPQSIRNYWILSCFGSILRLHWQLQSSNPFSVSGLALHSARGWDDRSLPTMFLDQGSRCLVPEDVLQTWIVHVMPQRSPSNSFIRPPIQKCRCRGVCLTISWSQCYMEHV